MESQVSAEHVPVVIRMRVHHLVRSVEKSHMFGSQQLPRIIPQSRRNYAEFRISLETFSVRATLLVAINIAHLMFLTGFPDEVQKEVILPTTEAFEVENGIVVGHWLVPHARYCADAILREGGGENVKC